MEKDDGSSSGFPGRGLIVVALLAVGALIVTKPPLESSRPAITEPGLERREAAQDIDARLWQDPFGAVVKARERPKKSPDAESDEQRHSQQRFTAELQRQVRLSGDDPVFVVAVMLFSGPYAEQVESRRRMRYAVLAGLLASGFVPLDTDHLGYFYPYGGKGPKKGLPETIPFEVFERDPNAPSGNRNTDERRCKNCRLLVLWLDSAPFSDRPLRAMQELAENLSRSLPVKADGTPGVRWRVIGPASSDGLRAVVDEAAAAEFDARGLQRFDFRFFSSGATAPDDDLLHRYGARSETVSGYLEKRGIPLVRTTGTDDVLATELVRELDRRGLCSEPWKPQNASKCPEAEASDIPSWASRLESFVATLVGPSPDAQANNSEKRQASTIAIVTEADTLYGRTLRRQFGSRVRKTEGDAGPPRPGFEVTRWHYFRGIDGRLPGEAAPQATDGRKKESKTESADFTGQDGAYIERPEGTGQFDYLRRLANRIRAEDSERRRKGDHHGIRAVGMLGNDVYDKLLVLQALQPEIPHAVFFTTDLDARLFHPREQGWARNLIVASSYGLQLNDSLQRATAPFRDSYQTAAYLTTLMLVADARTVAKDHHAGPRWRQDDVRKWFEKPRIFEITRSSAFDFSRSESHLDAGNAAKYCRPWNLDEKCASIHPEPSPMWPTTSKYALWLVLVLSTAAIWVPALALHRGWRRSLRRFVAAGGPSDFTPLLRRGAILAAFAALVLVPAWLLVINWESIAAWLTDGGKPLSFTDGISPWPTYLLRFATWVLCLYFLWHAWVSLQSNVNRIAHEFHLGSTRRRLSATLAAERLQLAWWRRLASMTHVRFYPARDRPRNSDLPSSSMTPEAEKFWMHYIVQNRFPARLLRTSIGVAVMVLICALIWSALAEAPLPPQRGSLADFDLHIWTILPTALAAQILIFFVADATLLCVQFVRGLRLQSANWPAPTLKAFHARLGVPTQYLDDWIDLEFVARRTRCVAALIYYPFVVLSLLIAARSSFFDDWYSSPALHIVMGISFGIVLACAFALRRTAEASRRQALARVRDAILRAKGESGSGPLVSQLDALRDRIERLRDGAFAPYSQQPLLKAVLLPLLTFGGTSLFDYLSLINL